MSVTARIVLFIFIVIGLSGCKNNTPPVSTGTPAGSMTTPAEKTGTAGTSMVETSPVSTLPQTGVTPGTLIIKTLEGTPIPPTILPQDTPVSTSTSSDFVVKEKNLPNSQIQILEPGDLSQLASPIKVQASVFPGDGNLVNVQLFGEDGRLISDQLMKMVLTESGWVNLEKEIKFEISTAGESAMLVISTRDEFGRRIAQSTSQIFLMQIGKSDIESNDLLKQPFVVQSPRANTIVKGGVVHIAGYAHPFNSNPIIIELLTESGGVMESAIVKLPKITDGQNYAVFFADIPYQVDIRTPVRLSVRQRSILLPNIEAALSSQLITLDP